MYGGNKVSQLLKRYYICFFVVLFFYILCYLPKNNQDANAVFEETRLPRQRIILLRSSDDTITTEDDSNESDEDDSDEDDSDDNDSDESDSDEDDSDEDDSSESSDSSELIPPQLFFVNTSHCRMPYVDPFTPELRAIYNPPKYESCSNEADFVTPIFDVNLKRYVLNINESLARHLLNSSTEEYNCGFQEIIRSKTGDTYEKPLPKKYFSHGYVVPLHVEGMLVECQLASNASHKLQRDAFFLVQYKVPEPEPTPPTPRKPSVILFGIDAFSRINFRRTMPKVFEHMKKPGWYELQGYNKVADATFANLIPVLSGYDHGSTRTVCKFKDLGCLDRFPFIWHDFKNASYLTAYAEDESQISTFNLLKPGFDKPPFDFYFRPFLKAIEDNMRIYKRVRRYCVGRRILSTYIYDFCHHYMKRFVDERPIFGLFWTNHFSHERYSLPAVMSDRILQYFLDFEADGIMESTIMIFMADHGIRFGDLLKLPEGFLEERLPTMFIWLPPWFRQQYPQYVRGLEANRNRLTSNYDLYMTLKHIIQLGTPYDLKHKPAFDCPKCQSLFYPVPENRTCADVGVSDHWCTCNPYRVVTSLDYARQIPNLITDRMNDYFETKKLSKKCSKVKPRDLEKIELKLNIDNEGKHIARDEETYRTKFTINPNSAEFQATVRFNNRTKAIKVDVETISRLNAYHNDSLCINDKEAKKFCICYSSIKK